MAFFLGFLTASLLSAAVVLYQDRALWQKRFQHQKEQSKQLASQLLLERQNANRQALTASYQQGCYDARQTDAVYRVLFRKTQASSTADGNIITFPGNKIS